MMRAYLDRTLFSLFREVHGPMQRQDATILWITTTLLFFAVLAVFGGAYVMVPA